MNWIIPANVKIYDHSASFAARGYIDWTQGRTNFGVGDVVFIYCTVPRKKIMFKTVVEKTNIPFSLKTDDEEFWTDKEKHREQKSGLFVRLKLLEEVDTERLSLENLMMNGLNGAPQSAVRCAEPLLAYIEQHMNDFLVDGFFEAPEDDSEHYEGISKKVSVNKYERSSVARAKCIEFHGCRCLVCGMDFGKEYKGVGEGFIHVHHIVPMSEIKKEYKIDYKKDLVPVCPNCHAMLHRKVGGRYLTIEELKTIKAKSRI